MHFRPDFCRLASLLLLIALLNGCAAVVVGGAAAGALALHDRRTTGAIVDDEAIEVRARDMLHRDGPGRGNHIKVVSYNRAVLLAGEVRTEAERKAAETMVESIPTVRRIHNELGIGQPTGLGRRSRDAALTGQVKSSLLNLGLDGFDPARAKVVSVRGNVYLMGLVTPEEAELIAERAATLRGVRQVVKLFEYIKPDPDAAPAASGAES